MRRGGTLVSVRVRDEDASRVQAILDRFKPIDPAVRGAEYRKAGWKTFDPKAAALPAERGRDRAHAPRRRAGLAGFVETSAESRKPMASCFSLGCRMRRPRALLARPIVIS